MNYPPAIMDLRVASPDRRPIHLWLPLFLLWPLALVIGALALVFTILADVVLLLLGQRYHHYTLLFVRSTGALCALHGMVVRVNDGNATVEMTVQ